MSRGFGLTIDCRDPSSLSEFWIEVLGYKRADPPAGYGSWKEWFVAMEVPEDEWEEAPNAYLTDPEGRRPSIFLQPVPEPKAVKNRVHLDVDVTDRSATPVAERRRQIRAEADRLVTLGGTREAEYEAGDHYHMVMRDPEGNEFCLR